MSQTIEDEALNVLEENDLVILGLPGVGKSASAKAIAAKYIIKNNPSVVVSINRTIQKFEHHVEIIEVNDDPVPVSVISVPFKSINSSELLAMIVESMGKLVKILERMLQFEGQANTTLDKMNLANKIKDLILDILHQTPNEISDILEVGKILSEAIQYVTTALRITSLVLKHHQEYKLDELERQKMLIVVDDLEDLRPNWNILSGINYSFRYLFVIRIEEPQQYITLNKDRTFASHFLEDVGISSVVKERRVLPPPSFEVFSNIMIAHDVNAEFISDLWKYTGGFPATALMMWTAAGKKALGRVIIKLTNVLLTNNELRSTELPWKDDNIQTRINYTYYAAQVVYEELKLKNYAYVALCVQPIGVSVDELLIFCGSLFNQIYTCNNKNAKEVYEKIFNGRVCYPKILKVQLIESPCTGNERCKFSLETAVKEGIVEKFPETWDHSSVIEDQIVTEPAPTIFREHDGRVVYRFSHLFGHIPILLRQLEKTDADLHLELQNARKILLKVSEEETSFQKKVDFRIVFAAYEHLIQLEDDLNDVEITAINFFEVIFSKFPDLGYEVRNTAWKLVDIARADHVTLARLLHSYAQFAKQISHRYPAFSYEFTQKLLHEINEIDSDNKLVLFYLACSLPYIAIVLHFKSNLNTEQLLNRSKVLVEKICELEDDPVCLYAKSVVYPYLSDYFHAKGDRENFNQLINEAENAFSSLSNLHSTDRSVLDWLSGPFAGPEFTLMSREAHLNSIMGTFAYYDNNLGEAARKHQLATEMYKKLRSYDGHISSLDAKLVDDLFLATNDEPFRKCLEEISEVDRDIIDWSVEQNVLFLNVVPANISLLSFHAVLARHGLHFIYDQKYENENKALDPISVGKSNCVVYALQKMIKGYSNKKDFVAYALQYLLTQDYPPLLEDVRNMTLGLFRLLDSSQDRITISIDDDAREFNAPSLRKALTDKLENKLEKFKGDDFQIFCNIYHDDTKYDLLMKSLCSIISFMATRKIDAINLLVTLCLVNDNLEECLLLLLKTAHQSKIPLLRQIFKETAEKLGNYMKARSNEETETSAKELGKAYLKLWYYNRLM